MYIQISWYLMKPSDQARPAGIWGSHLIRIHTFFIHTMNPYLLCFVLKLYIPINNFSAMSGCLVCNKQRIQSRAQWHNTVSASNKAWIMDPSIKWSTMPLSRYAPHISIMKLHHQIDWKLERIIDCLGLIRLFFWFPERCFWASSVVHVVSVQ